jgi:hypothetical protein
MNGQFICDIHICGALENLGIIDVGNDRLIFARQVLVEAIDQLLPCDFLPFGVRHGALSFFFRGILSAMLEIGDLMTSDQ